MKDRVQKVAERVAQAADAQTPLEIRGGATKRFLGNPPQGEPLEVGKIRGIIEHDPSELTVTAYCGTPLAELEAKLGEAGQMLGFEPPIHDEASTLGGAIACGLSGPRRPAQGACRDFMLGVTVVDGSGEILSFGGKVIKNVAGFDVTRLMAGAMGALGVLVEATLRVIARPEREITCVLEMGLPDAAVRANELVSRGMPVSASCWHAGRLHLRLSGSESGVKRCAEEAGGERLGDAEAASFWQSVRNQSHPFFAGERSLWKVTIPPLSDPVDVDGDWLVEWHGAMRWLSSGAEPGEVRVKAAAAGGAATLFRAATAHENFQRFPELPAKLEELHKRLMDVFDPAKILNPGRMY